jgi:hypothetical protein
VVRQKENWGEWECKIAIEVYRKRSYKQVKKIYITDLAVIITNFMLKLQIFYCSSEQLIFSPFSVSESFSPLDGRLIGYLPL